MRPSWSWVAAVAVAAVVKVGIASQSVKDGLAHASDGPRPGHIWAVTPKKAHVRGRFEDDCAIASLTMALLMAGALPPPAAEAYDIVFDRLGAFDGQNASTLEYGLAIFDCDAWQMDMPDLGTLALMVDCGLPVVLSVIDEPAGHAVVLSGHAAAHKERWVLNDPSDARPRRLSSGELTNVMAGAMHCHALGVQCLELSSTCTQALCAAGVVSPSCEQFGP